MREGEHLAEIDEREEVDDAEASAAATERRREVQPAQVAIAEHPPEGVADVAAGDRCGPVGAASRTNARMAIAITAANSPSRTDVPRQPRVASKGTPSSAMTTEPTLPPAMCAEMANPRRWIGNCSARRPLPTGCCGDPPIRDSTLGTAKVRKLVANAWR